MELEKHNALAVKSQTLTLPQRLRSTILRLGTPDTKQLAKMEMMDIVSELMPKGNPIFLDVIKYPKISDLVTSEGRPRMLLLISIMIRDFCSSLNVVRNMNEDQIIEAASMLLEECDNFRMEDYTMMFAMAKRGQLVKIMDRIDISVITEIMDKYWIMRKRAGKEAEYEEDRRLSGYGDITRQLDHVHPEEAKLIRGTDELAGAIGDLKTRFQEWKEESKNNEMDDKIPG